MASNQIEAFAELFNSPAADRATRRRLFRQFVHPPEVYQRLYVPPPYDWAKSRLHKSIAGIAARCKTGKRECDRDYLYEVAAMRPPHCKCCGCELDYDKSGTPKVPSFDRVNNDLGYTRGNVQIICRECNRKKSNITPEYLKIIQNYMEENWTVN